MDKEIQYTGVYEGFTPIQVALLRAEWVYAVVNEDYPLELAENVFDISLLGGWHPDGFDHDDLQDELDWMEVTAQENSIDFRCGGN